MTQKRSVEPEAEEEEIVYNPWWIERNKYDELAGYVHQLMEGDTHHIEDMYRLLRSTGNADEDGFPLYPVAKHIQRDLYNFWRGKQGGDQHGAVWVDKETGIISDDTSIIFEWARGKHISVLMYWCDGHIQYTLDR